MFITNGINRDYPLVAKADAIALTLSEPANAQVSYQLDIYAVTDVGRTFVGSTNTVAAVNGAQPNRLVAYALCPGARAWSILATGPAPSAGKVLADLRASPTDVPPGAVVGVQRPANRLIVNGSIPSESGGGGGDIGLSGARTDFVAPIAFTGAFGSNESTTDTNWVFFFNSTTVPPNGTQAFFGLAFNVPPGGSFNFVAPPGGIFFPVGLTWALSSTPGSLTLSADNARVVTNAQW